MRGGGWRAKRRFVFVVQNFDFFGSELTVGMFWSAGLISNQCVHDGERMWDRVLGQTDENATSYAAENELGLVRLNLDTHLG